MKKYKTSTFKNVIDRFKKKNVVVIGDLLLDHYIWGDVSRISPEAPVPVVWVKNEGYLPGGACNVANNLVALGADVSVIGVVGDDEKGEMLRDLMEKKNIFTEGVFIDKKRSTIVKTRVIAHHQQIVRIDREDTNEIGTGYLKKVQAFLQEKIKKVDGVIIEDYGKGVITPALLRIVMPIAKKYKKMVAVDPKEDHFSYYKGVSVITPNNHEAEKAVGFRIKTSKDLNKAGDIMLKKMKAEVVLITLGEEGMIVFSKGKQPYKIPTLAQEVFDVSGAGDTVVATYALSKICGASSIISAHIANCAAGIVVGKVGAAVVSDRELMGRIRAEIKAPIKSLR